MKTLSNVMNTPLFCFQSFDYIKKAISEFRIPLLPKDNLRKHDLLKVVYSKYHSYVNPFPHSQYKTECTEWYKKVDELQSIFRYTQAMITNNEDAMRELSQDEKEECREIGRRLGLYTGHPTNDFQAFNISTQQRGCVERALNVIDFLETHYQPTTQIPYEHLFQEYLKLIYGIEPLQLQAGDILLFGLGIDNRDWFDRTFGHSAVVMSTSQDKVFIAHCVQQGPEASGNCRTNELSIYQFLTGNVRAIYRCMPTDISTNHSQTTALSSHHAFRGAITETTGMGPPPLDMTKMRNCVIFVATKIMPHLVYPKDAYKSLPAIQSKPCFKEHDLSQVGRLLPYAESLLWPMGKRTFCSKFLFIVWHLSALLYDIKKRNPRDSDDLLIEKLIQVVSNPTTEDTTTSRLVMNVEARYCKPEDSMGLPDFYNAYWRRIA